MRMGLHDVVVRSQPTCVLTLTAVRSYIKEFVHGDFGRTQPNLGSLLDTTCDILELDVEVRTPS